MLASKVCDLLLTQLTNTQEKIWSKNKDSQQENLTFYSVRSLNIALEYALKVSFRLKKKCFRITDLKQGQEIQDSESDKTASNGCIKTLNIWGKQFLEAVCCKSFKPV